MKQKPATQIACLTLALFLLGCCSQSTASEVRQPGPVATQFVVAGKPTLAPQPMNRPQATATRKSLLASETLSGLLSTTLTGGPLTIGPSDQLSPKVMEAVLQMLADGGLKPVTTSGQSDLQVTEEAMPGAKLAFERILVPVDRFSSMLEDVAFEELRGVWTGSITSPNFTAIYPSQDALPDLEALLGPPGPAVKPQAPEAVGQAVWGDPMSIGIVPFEALRPRLRALRLDGMSVVDNRLDQLNWPLARRAWVGPATQRGEKALAQVAEAEPQTNRDPKKLTVLVMTGVTAMARSTAVAIEKAGDYAFPARIVGPELAAADITTISNEIPFVVGCVPNNAANNLILCSKPEYFAALEFSGVDVVGLTGNHMNDFGYENMLATLNLYQDKNVPVYAGGVNEQAARAPLILEHHGNRLAFLGANPVGPSSDLAGPDTPGSAAFDQGQMIGDIQTIKPKVNLVLAELQYLETNAAGNYEIEPRADQVADFQALSDAGADIVTGVQAHAPQAVELRGDRIILYGLGNLYFDQTWSWPTRTGLVARHTIYDGRLLNTELLVTVIDPDFQLRWATPVEKRQVLKEVFGVSRW